MLLLAACAFLLCSTEAEAGFALRHQPEQNSTMVRFLSSIVGYGVANALLGAFTGKTLRDVLCATPADLQKCCPQLTLASARCVVGMFERMYSVDG